MYKFTIQIIYFFLLCLPIVSFGQSNTKEETSSFPVSFLREEIILNTDRTLYSVNEKIYFKAHYRSNKDATGINWSTVLYMELIKPNGTPIEQFKFPLTKEGSNGYVKIPKDILTGNYYLKAYTRWMRNYPVDNYAYTQLKIVNPVNPKLGSESDDQSETKLKHQTLVSGNNIVLKTDKSIYKSREKVTVSLKIEDESKELNTYSYTLLAVKKGSRSNTTLCPTVKNPSPVSPDTKFYPEINGISLSGKASYTDTREPAENIMIDLSLLNNQSYFSSFKTSSSGEFHFSFPSSTTMHDFFIAAENDNSTIDLQVDKEFCSKPLALTPEAFHLSETERILARELCINTQILENFTTTIDTAAQNLDKKSPKLSFYGTPNRVIYTEKYIDLPFLEEFIFELIPEISVSYKKKVPSLKTNRKHTLDIFPFLVLVDNIPINDLSEFLKIRTNKIERVEIVDQGYVIGNTKYRGVINAFTINEDLAGIQLPLNSMFFSYKMYANQQETNTFKSYQEEKTHIPDRRNCLYWNPNVSYIPGTNAEFSFNTSDLKGDYQLILHSFTKDSHEIIYSEIEFKVE